MVEIFHFHFSFVPDSIFFSFPFRSELNWCWKQMRLIEESCYRGIVCEKYGVLARVMRINHHWDSSLVEKQIFLFKIPLFYFTSSHGKTSFDDDDRKLRTKLCMLTSIIWPMQPQCTDKHEQIDFCLIERERERKKQSIFPAFFKCQMKMANKRDENTNKKKFNKSSHKYLFTCHNQMYDAIKCWIQKRWEICFSSLSLSFVETHSFSCLLCHIYILFCICYFICLMP